MPHMETYREDLLRSRLGREHGENSRAGADVHHQFILEELRVAQDCLAVRPRPDRVLEQCLEFMR